MVEKKKPGSAGKKEDKNDKTPPKSKENSRVQSAKSTKSSHKSRPTTPVPKPPTPEEVEEAAKAVKFEGKGPLRNVTANSTPARSRNSSSRSKASKPVVPVVKEPSGPLPPTDQEVNAGLSQIGKKASGIGQGYLTLSLHNHPGAKSTDFLSKHLQLQTVNLSNNVIEDTRSLGRLEALCNINLANNKITKFLDFEPETRLLRHADFSDNQISALRDLTPFYALHTIILDNNQITSLEGMSSAKALQVLSLPNNQVTSLRGLENLQLQELYVSDNMIDSLEPLVTLRHLRTVIAQRNRLTNLKGIEPLYLLTHLDVSENLIHSMEELKKAKHLNMLKNLNTHGNAMEVSYEYRLNTVHALPSVDELNDEEITTQFKVHAANLHGGDFQPTSEIRARHFPNGELDDDGNADTPACVMLPASKGEDGSQMLTPEVDVHAESPAANQAALAASSVEDFAKYFTAKFKDATQVLRCVFVWMVKNGNPKCAKLLDLPACTVETGPILKADLAAAEAVLMPSDGGANSGVWFERVARLFTSILIACGLDACEVTGYYAPPDWMPHDWMPLIAPNSMWTRVRVNELWRLVDIAKAVQRQSIAEFFTTPEVFLKTHYPLFCKSQLMPNPIKLVDFWPEAKETARIAGEKRVAEAKAAAVQLETNTRDAASKKMADAAVDKVVTEETLEIEMPGRIASQAIAYAIANEQDGNQASGQ